MIPNRIAKSPTPIYPPVDASQMADVAEAKSCSDQPVEVIIEPPVANEPDPVQQDKAPVEIYEVLCKVGEGTYG